VAVCVCELNDLIKAWFLLEQTWRARHATPRNAYNTTEQTQRERTLRAVCHFLRRNVCNAFEFVIDTKQRAKKKAKFKAQKRVLTIFMAASAHDKQIETQQRAAFYGIKRI